MAIKSTMSLVLAHKTLISVLLFFLNPESCLTIQIRSTCTCQSDIREDRRRSNSRPNLCVQLHRHRSARPITACLAILGLLSLEVASHFRPRWRRELYQRFTPSSCPVLFPNWFDRSAFFPVIPTYILQLSAWRNQHVQVFYYASHIVQ